MSKLRGFCLLAALILPQTSLADSAVFDVKQSECYDYTVGDSISATSPEGVAFELCEVVATTSHGSECSIKVECMEIPFEI